MSKKILPSGGVVVTLLAVPLLAGAQALDAEGAMSEYLVSIISFINVVAIPFLLGVGFLFFVWGMFRYFIVGGADEDARSEGKNVIIYSVLGFVFVFIFWGLVVLVTNFTGLGGQAIEFYPTVSP